MSQLIVTKIATFSLKSDVHAQASSHLAHDISTMFLHPSAVLILLLSVNQGCWPKILTAMLIIGVVLHNSLTPSTNFMHIQFLLISGCLNPRGKTRASAVLIKQ
jgi:hypothetical protein